jgi:hypothetical protein
MVFLVFKAVAIVNVIMGKEQSKLGHGKDIAKPRRCNRLNDNVAIIKQVQ